MTYNDLLLQAANNDLITKEKPLLASKGRIKGNRIAIKQNLPQIEKKCVLAEELGHHYTTVGDILDQDNPDNRKQELCARIIAYDNLVGLRGIVDAYNHHCQNVYDAAMYLDVTEEFLNDALTHYKNKYGIFTTIDNSMSFS